MDEAALAKLIKDKEYFEERAYDNMRQNSIITGERDILAEDLRKFRVQDTSHKKALDYFGNIWRENLSDPESFDKFIDLRANILCWSKREVIELSQFDNLQGRDRELLFGEVAKVVLLDGSDKLELPRGLQRRGSRALVSVLCALLTNHLYTTVFSDPFFFFGEETSQILNDIMSLGNTWNLGHAQRWRGDTLRLIHPLHNTPDETIVKSETKKLLRNAAISAATKFMRSPAKYIMNNKPGALQILEDLYVKTAEHAYLIWCKRPMIRLHDPTRFLGQPYDPHNIEMVLLDSVATGGAIEPDGQPISMVTSPAILRYGLRAADEGVFEERWWHEKFGYQRASVWVYLPRPEEFDGDEENFKPMPLNPPPLHMKDLEPATFPLRSDLSVGDLGERMLKRFDRVTLLDLVKPYLDDLAEQLRPVLEGLREEVAQRIEERNEMEKQRDELRNKYREALQSIERLKSGM
ncbi:uncharacterized protein EAF01_003088 [Botrytis porri]|uniref:uncharacterized protein n=1 Tax=Botrytis porri TaxID=87229 RepID=UPI001901A649|nr:uncharacterized protein EAF01_003088 [Botrytis porri]KAF7909370.1 hypothetical protein EAF01_003088 [Botrytis porri]